jgi:hypothetical protein
VVDAKTGTIYLIHNRPAGDRTDNLAVLPDVNVGMMLKSSTDVRESTLAARCAAPAYLLSMKTRTCHDIHYNIILYLLDRTA